MSLLPVLNPKCMPWILVRLSFLWENRTKPLGKTSDWLFSMHIIKKVRDPQSLDSAHQVFLPIFFLFPGIFSFWTFSGCLSHYSGLSPNAESSLRNAALSHLTILEPHHLAPTTPLQSGNHQFVLCIWVCSCFICSFCSVLVRTLWLPDRDNIYFKIFLLTCSVLENDHINFMHSFTQMNEDQETEKLCSHCLGSWLCSLTRLEAPWREGC